MNFRIVKDAILTILGTAEAGRYQTIGFQRQRTDASQASGNNRFVQCYYSAGDFSTRGGRLNGPIKHDMTFRIDLTVSAPAQVDLAVINNPTATPSAKATALANLQESSAIADESLDELVEIVYQVLMHGLNLDLGLSKGTVANKWLTDINKDRPIERGELMILTGSMRLTVRTTEQVEGDIGTAGTIFDTTIDIDGDDVERGGVTVDNS